MARYEINKSISFGGTHHQTVEASKYEQHGEYFVFFAPNGTKVLTIQAKSVTTIDLLPEEK